MQEDKVSPFQLLENLWKVWQKRALLVLVNVWLKSKIYLCQILALINDIWNEYHTYVSLQSKMFIYANCLRLLWLSIPQACHTISIVLSPWRQNLEDLSFVVQTHINLMGICWKVEEWKKTSCKFFWSKLGSCIFVHLQRGHWEDITFHNNKAG